MEKTTQKSGDKRWYVLSCRDDREEAKNINLSGNPFRESAYCLRERILKKCSDVIQKPRIFQGSKGPVVCLLYPDANTKDKRDKRNWPGCFSAVLQDGSSFLREVRQNPQLMTNEFLKYLADFPEEKARNLEITKRIKELSSRDWKLDQDWLGSLRRYENGEYIFPDIDFPNA